MCSCNIAMHIATVGHTITIISVYMYIRISYKFQIPVHRFAMWFMHVFQI